MVGWALSRDHTLQGECRTPLSLRRPSCYFKTSLKRRAERDDTALNSESIMRPIYQLGSLYTINKHIPAVRRSAPRGALATSSSTIVTHRETLHRSRASVYCSLICLVCRLVRRTLCSLGLGRSFMWRRHAGDLESTNIWERRAANWTDWVTQPLSSWEAQVETRLTWPNCFAYSVK